MIIPDVMVVAVLVCAIGALGILAMEWLWHNWR